MSVTHVYDFTREVDVKIEVSVDASDHDRKVSFVRAWDPETNSPIVLTQREIYSITTPTKFGQTWQNEYERIIEEAQKEQNEEASTSS